MSWFIILEHESIINVKKLTVKIDLYFYISYYLTMYQVMYQARRNGYVKYRKES